MPLDFKTSRPLLLSRVHGRDDPGGLAHAPCAVKGTRCGQGLALALDGPVGKALLDPVGIGVQEGRLYCAFKLSPLPAEVRGWLRGRLRAL